MSNDTFIPIGIAIAHAFGRFGCFWGGCCYGQPAAWGLPCSQPLSFPFLSSAAIRGVSSFWKADNIAGRNNLRPKCPLNGACPVPSMTIFREFPHSFSRCRFSFCWRGEWLFCSTSLTTFSLFVSAVVPLATELPSAAKATAFLIVFLRINLIDYFFTDFTDTPRKNFCCRS